MDFIPYDIFKDLMLDLVGKYNGPPIAPTDIQDLQSTAPPLLSLSHLSSAGQADPKPQSDKTNISDNKQHACDNISSIKGSDPKGGDSTSGSPIESCEKATNSKSVLLTLDSRKKFISPGHPNSRKSVSLANSNKQPSKSCPAPLSLDTQKNTSSHKHADHGQSVSSVKTKGHVPDGHSRLQDDDYKKDSSSTGHSDHRQTVSTARSKNATFISRSEIRDIQVSSSEQRDNYSLEKSHGTADITKAEEKLNTEVAAASHTKDDRNSHTMKEKLSEQEPSYTVDENTKMSVEKLARFVVEMGLGMDAFHAEKLANNPNFSFLKAGRTAAYELLKTKLFEFRQSFGSSAQIKQHDSGLKEPIQKFPQALQKSADSTATPQTDCFTAPMLPPLRKRKAGFDASAAPMKKITQDETLKVDAKTRDAAEELARFVVRMGPKKEQFTKAEAANPKFWFLNQKDHPAYEFFQMKLAEFSKAKQAGEISNSKTPVTSKPGSEPPSPTDQATEPRSALLLLSEIYDSDEEDSKSKDDASQNGRQRGHRQRKSRPQRGSSDTKRTSSKHDARVGIRSKVSELQKYLRSAEECANRSVRVIILARKIGAVKKKLARDIAASKKKNMTRTTIGTQTELKVPLAKAVPASVKSSTPKKRPPAKVKMQKTLTRETPVMPESPLQSQFSDVDARTKETAENLARFFVEVGPSIEGGLNLDLVSKNPEFWFLNDKHSSAYKFFQMKHAEFHHNRSPDSVKCNNLGKATLQDSESQQMKHAEFRHNRSPDPVKRNKLGKAALQDSQSQQMKHAEFCYNRSPDSVESNKLGKAALQDSELQQMMHAEFHHNRRPDPVKSNNLGKAALQDSESQTSKSQDSAPPEVKPLVPQDTDSECYIVEPENPTPQSSEPVELVSQAAEPMQPAQQPSEAVQAMPQSSEPPEPEPDYSIMVSCCSDEEDDLENP